MNRAAGMSETDEFIVESENPERKEHGELTGWETIVFEIADDEEESFP